MACSAVEPGAALSFELDGDILLYVEQSGRLILLNETGSSLWRGLQAGFSLPQISKQLASATGAPLDWIRRDCERALAEWTRAGVFEPTRTEHTTPDTRVKRDHSSGRRMPDALACRKDYRLLDFTFALHGNAGDLDVIDDFIGHLAVDRCVDADAIYEVTRRASGYGLFENGRMIDECADSMGLIPMIHGNLMLAAYHGNPCVAALHSAAVALEDRCLLLPGRSGHGKSTLTAALLGHGFGYCTDDLVLLSGDPIRARGVPMGLGLKRGAWSALASDLVEIETASVHRRADGQLIRYLPPRRWVKPTAAHPDALVPACVIFPRYLPGASVALEEIGPARALQGVTEAGYDVPDGLDGRTVAALVDWLSQVPCYSLRFASLDGAVRAIKDVFS